MTERDTTTVSWLQCTHGDVQLVRSAERLGRAGIGLDVQAEERHVTGHTARTHAYLIISHAEAAALRDCIAAILAEEDESTGQARLQFCRRAAA